MIDRAMTGWRTAFSGIALALAFDQPAAAQSGPSEAEPGECMPSPEPHECPDRCPSFETCYIDDGDGLIYYRVGDQRFDCDELDCRQASTTLGDYCCLRGQFAPSSEDGGGGCALRPGADRGNGTAAGSCLAALGVVLARRRGRMRPRSAGRVRSAVPGADVGLSD
jgi:hypothetical protein